MPFGENDAAHQFGKADAMTWMDKAPREMPHFLAMWYRHNPNDFYAPIYPAPVAINIAMMQILAQQRFQPVNLYYAVTCCFMTIAAVYLLLRKTFGFLTAFLSGFFLVFMLRNIYFYLWGQRPALIALSFVPLTIYCFYKYMASYVSNKEKPAYIYIVGVFFGIMAYLHPTSVVAAVFPIMLLTILFWIKNKRIPFSIKSSFIAVILFVVIFSPFLPDILGQSSVRRITPITISSFLHWYVFPNQNPPNPFLYSFREMNGGYWTVPFIIIGIAVLVLRKSDKDLVMLSWLVGLYLALHIGTIFVHSRSNRILTSSAHVLWPIAVIGLLSIPSLLGLRNPVKKYLKYFLIGLFLILVINFNAKPAMNLLKESYKPYLRVTPPQLKVAEWIDQNLPEYALLYIAGPMTYPKQQWIHVLSHRAMQTEAIFKNLKTAQEASKDIPVQNRIGYVVVDYSDAALMLSSPDPRAQQRGMALHQHLQRFEESLNTTLNATLIYNRDKVKVYKLGE